MKSNFFWLLLFFSLCEVGYTQVADTVKWWNPVKNNFPVLEGQAWANELKNPCNNKNYHGNKP